MTDFAIAGPEDDPNNDPRNRADLFANINQLRLDPAGQGGGGGAEREVEVRTPVGRPSPRVWFRRHCVLAMIIAYREEPREQLTVHIRLLISQSIEESSND